MDNNELMHFGIKGQKWGVRRFQNPDGTLTEEGKRRQAKQEVKQLKKEARRIAKQEKANRRMYKLSDISTEELRKRTDRLNTEKSYIEAVNNVNKLNPKYKTRGQQFIDGLRDSVWGKMIKPAMEDTGKRWVAKMMRDMMNVRTEEDVKYDKYKNQSQQNDKKEKK